MSGSVSNIYRHHHHHHHPHRTTGLTWCRHSSASGPHYRVSVTHVVSVRKSWKTDTSSTQYGMTRRLALTWRSLVGRSKPGRRRPETHVLHDVSPARSAMTTRSTSSTNFRLKTLWPWTHLCSPFHWHHPLCVLKVQQAVMPKHNKPRPRVAHRGIARFLRIDPKLNHIVPLSLLTVPENFMQIGPAVFS